MSTAISPKASRSFTYLQLLFASPVTPACSCTAWAPAVPWSALPRQCQAKKFTESAQQSPKLNLTFTILFLSTEGLLNTLAPFLQWEGASIPTSCPLSQHPRKEQVTEQTSIAFSKRYRLLKIAQFQLLPQVSTHTEKADLEPSYTALSSCPWLVTQLTILRTHTKKI